jgi:hypothetical protein
VVGEQQDAAGAALDADRAGQPGLQRRRVGDSQYATSRIGAILVTINPV